MCCKDKHGGHAHDYPYTSTVDVQPLRYCRCLGTGLGIAAEPYTDWKDGECCAAWTNEDGLCDRCRANCGNSPDSARELTDHMEQDTPEEARYAFDTTVPV